METGVDLQAPDSVRRLQTALHARAKGDPECRFYTLSDKVWREGYLLEPLRLLPAGATVAGRDSPPAGKQRLSTAHVKHGLFAPITGFRTQHTETHVVEPLIRVGVVAGRDSRVP